MSRKIIKLQKLTKGCALRNCNCARAAIAVFYLYTSRRGVVVLLRALEQRSGVQNCIETPLVFVRKGIRNLKCYVDVVKSLVRKRVCNGKLTLNQHV